MIVMRCMPAPEAACNVHTMSVTI